MGFVTRKKAYSKIHIPETARKEIQYINLQEVLSLVKEFHMHYSITLNFGSNPGEVCACWNSKHG